MAASIFTGLSNLSPLIDTQTDADSPENETLWNGVRYFLEGLAILGYSTGNTGAVTTITETVLTDSGETWTVDEHINRTLVMTSGLAIGNMYQIDDNTADTLTCTGDTMVSDGVAIGDDFEIFFDLLNNTDGHDHDGVNSKSPVLADATVSQAKLSTGTSSGTVSTSTDATMTGGTYSFYPQTAAAAATNSVTMSRKYHASAATYIGYEGASGSALWNNRYITSSGEIYWIFLLRNKTNGEIEASSFANDHVCFGNSGNPILVPHPFDGFDPSTHEVIVINPEIDQVRELYNKMREPVAFNDVGNELKAQLRKNFDNNYLVNQVILKKDIFNIAQIWLNEYSLNETTRPKFPTKEVTVDLPFEDKFDAQRFLGQKVETIKKQIPEPKNILTARLL